MHQVPRRGAGAGGSNNGEPGPRPDYGPDYYGAFIYDLDGNKIEATLSDRAQGSGGEKADKEESRQASRQEGEEEDREEGKKEITALNASELVRCGWSGEGTALRRLSRRRMGRAGIRSARALREARAGRFPGRAVLDHDSRKRENFRAAFDDFEPEKIARYGKRDVERLMKNEGIIRSGAEDRSGDHAARSSGSRSRRRSPAASREFIWKHVDGRAEGQSLQDDQASPRRRRR